MEGEYFKYYFSATFIFVPVTCFLIYVIFSIRLALLQVQLTPLGSLLYIIGFVLFVLAIFSLPMLIWVIVFLSQVAPLVPNIVIFFVFRLLNLFHADLSAYFLCEVCLSLTVLFCAMQYMINCHIIYKFKWIRRECRLLHAVCDDISEALQVRDHTKHKDCQMLEMTRLQLSEEEEQWVKTTKDVVSDAEPFIKAFPAHMGHLLNRQLLFLRLYKLLSIAKNISRQKDKSAFVKAIYEKLKNSRSKLRILEGIFTKDDSESASPKHLLGQVTTILHTVTTYIPESKRRNLDFKLVLLEAFLKDLEDVEMESAIERAWFENIKVLLDDMDNTHKLIVPRQEEAGWYQNLQGTPAYAPLKRSIEVDWMAKGLAELLEAMNAYSLKFTRIQRQTYLYQMDVLSNEDHMFYVVNSILDHLNQQAITCPEADSEIRSLCNRLEKMHTNLKAIEGVSYFRLVSSEEMRNITSELKKAFENYIRELETWLNTKWESSSIERQIKDIERFIEAYDFKVRRKSSSIIGLEENTDALVSRLTTGSDQCCVFAIVGMQGIGKSTLAKKVYHHKEILSHFPHCRWVSVPKACNDVNDLLEDVGNQITRANKSQEKQTEKGKEHGIQKIRKFLQENRYLVILDSVSTTMVWDVLKDAFPESKNGSRVLLTTRHMTVASHAEQSHQLRLRTKDESWELFLEKSRLPLEFLSQHGMLRKAKEVVGSCWGLPLLLSRLSVLMAGETLDSLQLSKAFDLVHQFQTLWSEVLQINELPNHLWPLLSYITLFPKSYEIPARRLIALWVAEELVQQCPGKTNTLEKLAESYLLQLIDLNIIQPMEKTVDGKAKTCCLPEPLRDVVLTTSTCSHQQRLMDLNHRNDASFELIHGAESSTHPQNVWRNYENLVSMISFDIREGYKPGNDIGNFIRRGIAEGCFKKLKVLDLERVFRPQLPKTIGKLIELRYLGLRWTYLEEIPSTIGNLLNLQTLDLKHTYIRTLPNTIWKLQKLRHLYLNQKYRSKFVHQSRTRSLHNLQTLWGVFLDENSPLRDQIGELKSLRKLELAFQLNLTQQEELANRIVNLEHLQSLWLSSVNVMSEPQSLYLGTFSGLKRLYNMHLFGRLENDFLSSKFPDSLSDLTLSATGLQYDPMPILEKLPNLKSLSLFSDSFKGVSMDCSRGGFSQLLVLKMWKLGGITDWTIEEQAMQRLKKLEIKCCPLLKVPDGLRHLKTLREVKLRSMPEAFIARLIEYTRYRWENKSLIPSIINY